MTVATKKVEGRRTVRYASLNDLLTDAEQLSTMKFRTLGNWSFGQILKHIAMSLDSSIDGVGFALPAPARWLMSLLMKGNVRRTRLSERYPTTNGINSTYAILKCT